MQSIYSYNITITELAQDYLPNSIVKKDRNVEMITFTWYQVLFNQAEIIAFWRACNHYHLRPVAKTVLGKIKSIKIIHEI